MALYARTNWSLYRTRYRVPPGYSVAVEASGDGATATASAPDASAGPVTVTLTGFRLIDRFGAALESVTDITALIYKTVPSSAVAPDKRVGSVSTDGSGTLSDIDISDIQDTDDPVFLILMKDGSPAKGTTVKLTPTVS